MSASRPDATSPVGPAAALGDDQARERAWLTPRIMVGCGAAQALGVHWGTFQLTNEGRDAPRRALAAAVQARGVSSRHFLALEPGEIWPTPAVPAYEISPPMPI